MPRIPRIIKALSLVLVWAVTVGAIRKDEFLCEEAHARLVECCPGFATGEGYCTYSEGCGGNQFTALSPEESHCIRNATCEKIREKGICAQAMALEPPRYDDDAGVPSDPWRHRGEVCE